MPWGTGSSLPSAFTYFIHDGVEILLTCVLSALSCLSALLLQVSQQLEDLKRNGLAVRRPQMSLER